MGRATVILFLYLALAACSSPYVPTLIEVTDASLFSTDVKFCQAAANAYRPEASAGSVAYGAISGGTGNISYALINPLIPALGAAGGIAGAAAAGFDITGQVRRNVAKHCIEDKTNRDHSALVANPDP